MDSHSRLSADTVPSHRLSSDHPSVRCHRREGAGWLGSRPLDWVGTGETGLVILLAPLMLAEVSKCFAVVSEMNRTDSVCEVHTTGQGRGPLPPLPGHAPLSRMSKFCSPYVPSPHGQCSGLLICSDFPVVSRPAGSWILRGLPLAAS